MSKAVDFLRSNPGAQGQLGLVEIFEPYCDKDEGADEDT